VVSTAAVIAENHLGNIRTVEYVHDIADKCLQGGDGIRALMQEKKWRLLLHIKSSHI
jgi:hypothetical protein